MHQDISDLFDNDVSVDEQYDDFFEQEKEEKITKEDITVEHKNEDIDKLFDNLTSDVSGATNYINEIMSKKNSIDKIQEQLDEDKYSFEREKKDFKKYVQLQEHNQSRSKSM